MRVTKLLLICMCCVITVPSLWSQTANSVAKPGILGYLDPHTGAFRPVPSADDESRGACGFNDIRRDDNCHAYDHGEVHRTY